MAFFDFLRSGAPSRRAVVTGIGVVSPIGIGVRAFWENAKKGETGVGPITLFDTSGFPFKLAAEVKDWDSMKSRYFKKRELEVFSRSTQFAVVAAREAMEDAALFHYDPNRLAVQLGVGLEGHAEQYLEIKSHPERLDRYSEDLDPRLALKVMIFSPATVLALKTGARGEVTALSSACASAYSSVGSAIRLIQSGAADYVLAGGTEAPINVLTMSTLMAAEMVTTETDPARAVCPFDRRRKISAMGEGSAILMIEDYAHARARGARIYCELAGYASAPENMNIYFTQEDTGRDMAAVMRQAVGGQAVDLVNAHGPGHYSIDLVECSALRLAFGDARSSAIPIVSDKSLTGSGLAAAGALQIALGALMLFFQERIPTANYLVPDPAIPLNVSRETRKVRIEGELNDAKALGGINSALYLKRCA